MIYLMDTKQYLNLKYLIDYNNYSNDQIVDD